MFSEDDLLPISALQHLAFCARQWGLMHLEGIWDENPLTVGGHHLHEKVDAQGTESRGDLRIAHSLRLRSLRLGLVGIADTVEFHRVADGGRDRPGAHVVVLTDCDGWWSVVPVEYKHGRPKPDHCDEVQVCAQAMCLEEMLDVSVAEGLIYYGKTRRRHAIAFGSALHEETERLSTRLHELTAAGVTPNGHYEKKCRSCSLLWHCQPKVTTGRSAADYLVRALNSGMEDQGGDV